MVTTIPAPIPPKVKTRDHSGKWINSQLFNEEGRRFHKHGYFTTEPLNSTAWEEYWDEQTKRCQEGYVCGGSKITGNHYEYLNFTRIEAVDTIAEAGKKIKSKTTKKETKNPDFWDGDYDYYWVLEIAKNGILNEGALASTQVEKEYGNTLPIDLRKDYMMKIVDRLNLKVKLHRDYLDGGYHVIIGKSRRKGYSYKNAAICTNAYNFIKKSITVIGAFDKKYLYPNGTMGKASEQLSFINENTAWSKAREYVDKQEHKKASFQKFINGNPVESGYQSELIAITFKDNPDAARGKDPLYVLLEEAGNFPNLKDSYNAIYPSLTAGSYITGQILIFGTGGDMESGTADFADMFFNPVEYGLFPVYNIWDENADNTLCGFFHPVYLNMEGYYDAQGNSDTRGALAAEMAIRENIRKHSTSSLVLQARVQEYPTCPSEAFLTVSMNDFPIAEIRQQYNRVIANNLHLKAGKPATLLPEIIEGAETSIDPFTGKVTFNPKRRIRIQLDLEGKLEPLWSYKPKTKNLNGAVVIFESPVPDAPKGLYKIGHDPYRQQSSSAALPSLASIYVYKSIKRGDSTRNQIVAQYVGRPYDPDDVNKILEYLAELYNTEIMYENEVTHVKDYFKRRNKLHLLAAQPDGVISAAIKASLVKRVYGIHMNDKLKDAGEKYIKKWLLTERDIDEDGNILLNLHFLYDPALLEELMLYNRKGNFDRVMGFMILMFQLAEDDEGQEYDAQATVYPIAQDFLALMESQFTNSTVFSDN